MRKKIIIPVVATLLTLVINSCAPTTPAKRIKKSPAVFEQLSPSDQELAKQGQIKEGMEKNAVLIALGQPSRVNAGSKDGVPFEKWFYTDATQAYNSVSYGHVGFGRRGLGRTGHGGFAHSTFGHSRFGSRFGNRRFSHGRFGGFGHSTSFVRTISAVVEFDSSGKVTNWSKSK